MFESGYCECRRKAKADRSSAQSSPASANNSPRVEQSRARSELQMNRAMLGCIGICEARRAHTHTHNHSSQRPTAPGGVKGEERRARDLRTSDTVAALLITASRPKPKGRSRVTTGVAMTREPCRRSLFRSLSPALAIPGQPSVAEEVKTRGQTLAVRRKRGASRRFANRNAKKGAQPSKRSGKESDGSLTRSKNPLPRRSLRSPC